MKQQKNDIDADLEKLVDKTIIEINSTTDFSEILKVYQTALESIMLGIVYKHYETINRFDVYTWENEFNTQVFRSISEQTKSEIIDYMITELKRVIFEYSQMDELIKDSEDKENQISVENELKYYSLQLKYYEFEKSQRTQKDNDSNLPSFIPNQKNIKIMLMYELGIFGYLESTYKDLNPNKLGQVIEAFTEINQETIKQTYREILGQRGDSPFKDTKKVSELNKIIIGLKLNKKG